MRNNNLIFVTSGTEKMYNFNGKKLLTSFLNYTNYKIIYFTENFNLDIENERIISVKLENYKYLLTWLHNNRNIIPKKYKGNCPNDDKIFINNPYNDKTCLWFRKIASLHYVYHNYLTTKKFNGMIWIDNDCEILNNINKNLIKNYLFNEKEIFICMGKQRKKDKRGVESGFWGIKNNFSFLEDIFDTYNSKNYKKSLYWGDGHIMGFLIEKNKNKYSINDLSKNSNTGNVILNTEPLNKYIVHHKGKHTKNDLY